MPGVTERAFVAGPIASAGGRVITSPFQFYTSGEDHLRIVSVNALTGVALKLRGRFIDNAGLILPLEQDHVPNTDRTTKTTTIGLGIGAVLNVDVFASSATPQQGQTFVIVQLVRGLGAASIVLGTLLAGYVTSTQHLAWPGSPLQASTDGPGALRNIVGTTPVAGIEISETVPTGAIWQFQSFMALFNSTPAGATRLPILFSTDGGQVGLLAPQSSGPSTITTTRFGWLSGYGLNLGLVGANIVTSLPVAYPLRSGTVIQTSTGGLSANDTWGSVNYTVREWLEVN